MNQKSTSAWGDESDEESSGHISHEVPHAEEDVEISENEDESDEEEQNTGSPIKDVTITKNQNRAAPARVLSRKEQRKLEMEELNSALAELGIPGSHYCVRIAID